MLGDGDGVVDAAHRHDTHRAAGTVHELDIRRKDVLDPVPVDRVRVPAADLHELEAVVGCELADARDEDRRAAAGARYSSTKRTLDAYAIRVSDAALRRELQPLGEQPAALAGAMSPASAIPPITMSGPRRTLVIVFHASRSSS